MLRLLVISHTYSAAINHAKLKALANYCELSVIYPNKWHDRLFSVTSQEIAKNYSQHPTPINLNGHLSLYFYSPHHLYALLRRIQPDLVYVEEEPHSIALAEVITYANRLQYRVCGFTWENIFQFYGVPGIHQYNLHHCCGFVAGNQEASIILKRKGFQKPICITPQLGIDPEIFTPDRNQALRIELGLDRFTVGFFGRIATEKGLQLLLQAALGLPDVDWILLGNGPQKADLMHWADVHQLSSCLHWIEPVPHEKIPSYLNALDALILPSITTSRWKEQFGHILLEAMACGIPVIGSNSGAIPEVISNAGIIIPEGDVNALQAAVVQLRDEPNLQKQLAQAGRKRVLTHYTHAHIAKANINFFQELCAL